MKENNILELLTNIEFFTDLEEITQKIKDIKKDAVEKEDQATAKESWIAQKIIKIHLQFRQAFLFLQDAEYFKAWCELERIEINFHNLKRHYDTSTNPYCLLQIEKNLRNLQVLYPYKYFMSIELLEKKKKCTICDKQISIRTPCGHEVGEIYDGEMCCREVTDVKVMGMALVEDPGNKFSVAFPTDSKTGEQIDNYNYYPLEYLMRIIKDPYTNWNLEVSERVSENRDYKLSRNDKCGCGSELKFKKCCLNKVGSTYPHYEFIFPQDIFSGIMPVIDFKY